MRDLYIILTAITTIGAIVFLLANAIDNAVEHLWELNDDICDLQEEIDKMDELITKLETSFKELDTLAGKIDNEINKLKESSKP